MRYEVRAETYPADGRDGGVIVLEGEWAAPRCGPRAASTASAGAPARRRAARRAVRRPGYVPRRPADWVAASPVLFPFPNRIRDGRIYVGRPRVPAAANDPSTKNAIHGFACRALARAGPGGRRRERLGDGRVPLLGRCARPRRCWPADFRIRADVSAAGGAAAGRGRGPQPGLDARCRSAWATTRIFGCRWRPTAALADCTAQAHARRSGSCSRFLPTGVRHPSTRRLDLERAAAVPRPAAGRRATGLSVDARRRWTACWAALRRAAYGRRGAAVCGAGVPRDGAVHAAAPAGDLPGAVHLHDRRGQPRQPRHRRRPGVAGAGRDVVGGAKWRSTRSWSIMARERNHRPTMPTSPAARANDCCRRSASSSARPARSPAPRSRWPPTT